MIDLHSGEEIKLIVRKHWFVFVGAAFSLLLLFLLPFGFYILLQALSGTAGAEFVAVFGGSVSGPSMLFVSILWMFFIWILGFIAWTDYYLDVWIVTNERIIDIEQHGFFRREISTFRVDRVQDITSEVHGIIPTFLNFGDIHVQTAGEDRNFVMKGAPSPTHLKQVISSLQRKSRSEPSVEEGV